MNTRARLIAAALVPCLAVTAVACSDDQPDVAPTTAPPTAPTTTVAVTGTAAPAPVDIVGTALSAVVFSTLAGLVVDADLVETLQTGGPFTVFAPTDDAFKALKAAAPDTLAAVQKDKALLTTVLTYHVVPGTLKLDDLRKIAAEGGKLATVAGPDLTISTEGDKVLVNGVEIAAGDVVASNGIIHVMTGVLVPPS